MGNTIGVKPMLFFFVRHAYVNTSSMIVVAIVNERPKERDAQNSKNKKAYHVHALSGFKYHKINGYGSELGCCYCWNLFCIVTENYQTMHVGFCVMRATTKF